MVYAGIDVHRKRSQVAILGDDGHELTNRNVANDPGELMALLGALKPGTPVAFEAAYGWGWLAELLEELELEPHLAHPLACKAIASARLKNDKVDARTLAHLLRSDLLPEAWIAPKEVRDRRALLRHRVALVRMQTSIKNRIHGALADEGIARDVDSLWGREGREWLARLILTPAHRRVVDDGLLVIDALKEPIRAAEREIRATFKPDPGVKALMGIYGVGLYTATTLAAEIGDVSRFPSPRKLCAWAGLTPVVRNSGSYVRHGHISKQGSKWARWVLIEAAHVAKQKPPLAHPFNDIARRRGKKIATVAIARKLLTRCYWVLKESSST